MELFKPVIEQTRSEGVFESRVDFGVLGTRSEPIPNLGGFETGEKTVYDVGEAEPEPAPVPEDFLGTSFDNMDRVADIDLDKEPQAPSEPIQTKTNQIPPPEEGQRKKRIKTRGGEQICPLIENSWPCNRNPLTLLHNPNI